MNLKMKKVATAVAVGLGASVVSMNAAYSDEVLFPYVVSGPTVTTVLSVVNNNQPFTLSSFTAQGDTLHYRYFYKSGSDATSKVSTCSEIDFRRVTSPNDIVTYTVDKTFADKNLGVLFEDPADQINANYTAANLPFNALRNITQPIRAFLVVDNNDFFGNGVALIGVDPRISVSGRGIFDDLDRTIYGEAMILEFGSGAAWGYKAYNPAGIYSQEAVGGDVIRVDPYDFMDRVETAGEVVAGPTPMAVLPFASQGGEFTTRLFVTPVSNYQLQGNLNAKVRFAVQDPQSDTFDAMYDRDENPVSGQVPMEVVCVAGLDADGMLTQGALGEVPHGGWTNVVVSTGTTSSTVHVGEATVTKLEFNDTTGTFNGVNLPGVFNNGFYLTKGVRETLGPAGGTLNPLVFTARAITVNTVTAFGFLIDDNSPCPGQPLVNYLGTTAVASPAATSPTGCVSQRTTDIIP